MKNNLIENKQYYTPSKIINYIYDNIFNNINNLTNEYFTPKYIIYYIYNKYNNKSKL